jgi:pyridoxal phosphate enzyme (YggS family)
MTEVSDRLAGIRYRVEEAAQRSGRSADAVTIIAVSKTFPIESILDALEAGVTHFGENKAQDFTGKINALSSYDAIKWHFVGHLQRNKVKSLIGRADLFHGLDSERLGLAIDSAAVTAETTVDCLVQVNVSGEESKFGISPDELPRLAETFAKLNHVRIRGLMTLASPSPDTNTVRKEFELLRILAESLPSHGHNHAEILSMGMSGDFEIAIEEGATHVRIGSGIFGSRSLVVHG